MEDLLSGGMAPDEDTQKNRFLTFMVDSESYGLEISVVTEIIGIQEITKIPETPDYIKGVINLRGRVIPVMDVRLRFRKSPMEYDDRTCIIVVDMKNLSVGLIVDSVSEVLSIQEGDIVPPPEFNTTKNRYVRGIAKTGGTIKMLLDCDRLLTEDEAAEASKAAAEAIQLAAAGA
ncbi:Chemotaxis protein CheW [bioreactor metagenome]|uniref:Chemotaxis protein CheW n=1 Tax=bioreactor metagenome TaxID=1076179 RepID=A0A645AN40_9ZZZZ